MLLLQVLEVLSENISLSSFHKIRNSKLYHIHENYPEKKKKEILYVKKDLLKHFRFSHQISTLIHCASSTPPKKSEKKCYEENIIIDENIISAIKGSKINKIIFLSSISVYKKNNDKIISENSPLDLKSKYSLSKINMEKKLKKLHKKSNDLDITILRLSGVLGYNSHSNFISSLRKIFKFNKIKVIKIFNSKKLYNSCIHVSDLYKIITKILKTNLKNNYLILNIFSKQPLTWKKIFSMFKNYFKSKIIVKESKQKKISYLLSSINLKKIDIKLPSMKTTISKYLS